MRNKFDFEGVDMNSRAITSITPLQAFFVHGAMVTATGDNDMCGPPLGLVPSMMQQSISKTGRAARASRE